MNNKPTAAELETLLDGPRRPIIVLPNGEIKVRDENVKLADLLQLIHEEACRGYWSVYNHCEGTYDSECIDSNCPHTYQCQMQKEIDEKIKVLKEKEGK